MPGIILPERRKLWKPGLGARINWAHPLAQGLKLCYLFNENGGIPHDLVANVPLTAVPGWTGSAWGAAITIDGTHNAQINKTYCDTITPQSGTPFSAFALVDNVNTGGLDVELLYWALPAVSGAQWQFQLQNGFGTGAAIRGDSSFGTHAVGGQLTGPSSVSFAVLANNNLKVANNGKVALDGNTTAPATTSGGGSYGLATSGGGGSCRIALLAFWPTYALTSDQMVALAADPYAFILSPGARQRYFVLAPPASTPRQMVRASRRAPALPPRRAHLVTPVRPQVPVPPFIPPRVAQPRIVRGLYRSSERSRLAAPVPPSIPVPKPILNEVVQRRSFRGLYRSSIRARLFAPPFKQPVSPPYIGPNLTPRRTLRGWWLFKRRSYAVVPPQEVPNLAPVQPRRPRGWRMFIDHQPSPVPSQIAAPPFIPPNVARRVQRLWLARRGRAALPTPPQIAVPPTIPGVVERRTQRFALARRGRAVTPAPPQEQPRLGVQQPRRARGWLRIRPRQASVTPAPVAVPPTVPGNVQTRHQRGWRLFRGSQVPIPPPPPTPGTQALPPTMLQRRAFRGWRRTRPQQVAPVASQVPVPPYVPPAVRPRRWTLARGIPRGRAVTPAQEMPLTRTSARRRPVAARGIPRGRAVTPSSQVDSPASRSRGARWFVRAVRRAIVGPPPVQAPPPPYPPTTRRQPRAVRGLYQRPRRGAPAIPLQTVQPFIPIDGIVVEPAITYRPTPIRRSGALVLQWRLSGIGTIKDAPRLRRLGDLFRPVVLREPPTPVLPEPESSVGLVLPPYRTNQPTFGGSVERHAIALYKSVPDPERALVSLEELTYEAMSQAAVAWASDAQVVADGMLADANLPPHDWNEASVALRLPNIAATLWRRAQTAPVPLPTQYVQGATLTRGVDPMLQALLVAVRTQVERAGRAGFRAWALANSDIVSGWQWTADLNVHTCPACFALHGSIHTLNDQVNDHPYGTCGMDPVLVGVATSRENGEVIFASIPPNQQLAILGPRHYELYVARKMTLADVVRYHQHDDHGEWIGVKPLYMLR